ncbi:hypothetical protein [Gordonia aichiensis]
MTENRTTTAQLEGAGYELAVAAEQFATGDTRVVREGERYYLIDPALQHCPADALLDTGAPIMQRINAACRMADPGFRSLTLSGAFKHSDGGVTVAVASAEIRARASAGVVVTTRDGTAQPPGPTAAQRLATAQAADPNVAAIVAVMGSGAEQLGWGELWKVYEHIGRFHTPEVGKRRRRAIETAGWATMQELVDFEDAANNVSTSGPDARHAVYTRHLPAGSPQPRPIDLPAGRRFINRLVESLVAEVL